jgi:hypothetical protein
MDRSAEAVRGLERRAVLRLRGSALGVEQPIDLVFDPHLVGHSPP